MTQNSEKYTGKIKNHKKKHGKKDSKTRKRYGKQMIWNNISKQKFEKKNELFDDKKKKKISGRK